MKFIPPETMPIEEMAPLAWLWLYFAAGTSYPGHSAATNIVKADEALKAWKERFTPKEEKR